MHRAAVLLSCQPTSRAMSNAIDQRAFEVPKDLVGVHARMTLTHLTFRLTCRSQSHLAGLLTQ